MTKPRTLHSYAELVFRLMVALGLSKTSDMR